MCRRIDGAFNIGARMHRRDEKAQARRFNGDSGIQDRLNIDSEIEQLLRQQDGGYRISDDDRNNRQTARQAGVEPLLLRIALKYLLLDCNLVTRSGSRCMSSSAFSTLAAIAGGIPTL